MFDPEYPRPQLVRPEWSSLNGTWEYAFSECLSPAEVVWQGPIQVPYPPESPLSGVKDTGFHKVVWYRRVFRVPAEWQGQRIHLHFGAVDYLAQVWVNGSLAATHEGGHTPFSADITDGLQAGQETVVIVRAADDPLDLEKPRGKQDWELEPHAIWYPRTTGIWQTVWLEPVSVCRISRLRVTPDAYNYGFSLEAEVERFGDPPTPGLELDVQVRLDGYVLASAVLPVRDQKVKGFLRLEIPEDKAARKVLLWSPENPVLFDLCLTLRQDETVRDRVETYAGLRSVTAHDGQFYLNGKPYFLQMVLDQGYWDESLLAAPNAAALRRDVELTKAMGFNGARKHQKIEDPRYLYWADRLGLLVWGEVPSAYSFSPVTTRRLAAEFIEMIERDYNHPCIVAWVPLNESWGVPDVPTSSPQRHLAQSLYHLAKALDSTRLVVDNDGWEHTETDLFTIHDYENKPEVFERRYNSQEFLNDRLQHGKRLAVNGCRVEGLPVILSEFGGVRMADGLAEAGWGYTRVNTAEEFVQLFNPLMKAAYGKTLTGYCYTQLADTFQEQNGLLYSDRRPKVDPAVIRQILQEGLQSREG